MNLEISIIIPALNEASKIRSDVQAACSFIAAHCVGGEIIVVDDGSRDRTANIAGEIEIPGTIKRLVIRLKQNSGKGFAVKTGILASTKEIVLVADSGLCTPFSDCLAAAEWIRSGSCDIALGSRLHRDTIIERNRPLKRRLLSRLFHIAAVLITGLPYAIKDSQCGFKLYRGEIARELFRECLSTGYLFELEIILRALRQGYKIKELPIRWSCDPDTRLSPSREWNAILKELFFVRRFRQKFWEGPGKPFTKGFPGRRRLD